MARTTAFEAFPDAYDEWFDRHPGLYAAELSAVRELLPGGRGGPWLEVGVGSGRFAAPLGVGFGVDPSPRMLGSARRTGIPVSVGIAERLPFAEGVFELVLMVTTICFVDDVRASLREARRVLEPGGCMLVGFVDRDSELGRSYIARRETSRFYGEATFVSAAGVLADLESVGFGIDGIRQTIIPGAPASRVLEGYGRGSFVVIRSRSPRW